MTDNGRFILNTADSVSYAGTISGSGSVLSQGSGMQTLAGAVGGSVAVVAQGPGTLLLHRVERLLGRHNVERRPAPGRRQCDAWHEQHYAQQRRFQFVRHRIVEYFESSDSCRAAGLGRSSEQRRLAFTAANNTLTTNSQLTINSPVTISGSLSGPYGLTKNGPVRAGPDRFQHLFRRHDAQRGCFCKLVPVGHWEPGVVTLVGYGSDFDQYDALFLGESIALQRQYHLGRPRQQRFIDVLLAAAGTLGSNSQITINSPVSIAASITGTNSLTITGSSTLTLAGQSTYTGG